MPRTRPRSLPRVLALAIGLASPAAVSVGEWLPVGPNDVGMVMDIAAGRTAVYAATCNGVYRSDDGGSSWREAGLPRENVVRLAVDPRPDADTLYAIVDVNLFVSPRPEPSHLGRSGLFIGSMLWVSRDGGQTWTQTPVFSGHAVAVDFSQPDTAYVANYEPTYAPLEVTHDSGATWTRVADAPDTIFAQIASDPRDGTLYGASGFLSTYSGGSWSALAIQVTAVAVGSGSDGAVYSGGFEFFCRKTSTASWTCAALPGTTVLNIVEIPASQTQPARILVVDFHGVMSSDDGGATFTRVSTAPAGFVPAAAVDHSGAAYVGNDTGVYRSADRGATWAKASAGLRSMWVRALAVDPSDASTIWAGGEARVWDVTQDGPGIFRSTNGGESWASLSVAGNPGYVFSLGLDPSDRRSLYTGSSTRVERTSDGGMSWSTARAFPNFVYDIKVDPDSSKVWAGADDSLKQSGDGGETWSTALSRSVYSILFDSRHPGTIYAGEAWEDAGFYYPFGTGFAVATSRDHGATWTRAGSGQEGGVIALATDPYSDGVVYAGTYAGTILRSPDGGATWERWDTQYDGFSVFAMVADPARPGRLYIGGWNGMYRSLDGGRSWAPFSEGLEPYGVFGLAITPDGRWLYAGTTGGGVYRRDLLRFVRGPVTPVSRSRTPRTVPRR